MLFWEKFICPAGDSSSCAMMVMCTGTSFAFCSSDLPPPIPPRTCSSPQLMSHLIQCPGSHGDVITVICVMEHRDLDSVWSFRRAFFKVSPVGIQFTCNRPSETLFFFPGALKCLCGTIATMFSQASGRDSQDLLAVFPSWLHLLDGEDNCMLSVPLSTSDLHYNCWQSGENCQVVSTGAFTLLGHAFWFS